MVYSESSPRGELLRKIRENHETLDNCKGHDFSIDLNPESRFSTIKKWKCSVCGGEVDFQAKYWYEEGVKKALTSVNPLN